MSDFFDSISAAITKVSDIVCGYPLFLLLIGGGLFLFIYSGGVSIRHLGGSLKALREKSAPSGDGQITSFQALMSAIASTVGMGNIAGVAIALTMGGPGAIFWMWVSAVVGMSTKFFEGTLAIMYKGKDNQGNPQGGTMYIIINGLGTKWKPLAYFFASFAMIGTLCVMQANQLVESITTVFTTPAGIENTIWLRFIMGVVICILVGLVIIGGIQRISKWASKIVPAMVGMYFILVAAICILNYHEIPNVFAEIFRGAFNLEAGIGGVIGTAIIGARRAAYVNEAGVGTASMMHGASNTKKPVKEGLIAMIGPAIDSGLVCTLTALPILIAGNYIHADGIKGLNIALGAFEQLLPGYGQNLLMIIVFFFAFSTMFSYSYYGQKCTNFLFGAQNAKYYNYFYLFMIIIAAMIPLSTVVSVMDLSFALMAIPTMTALLRLSPRVKKELKKYFKEKQDLAN